MILYCYVYNTARRRSHSNKNGAYIDT